MTVDSSKARRLASLEAQVQRLRAEMTDDEALSDEALAEQIERICGHINASIQTLQEQAEKLGEAFETKKHEPIDLRGWTRGAKGKA